MAAHDVAVIGLGAMGSAALAALAQRGVSCVGFDRFSPGHDRGSSHGATRIIRLGYFEHPAYVPLIRAAYPLWRELERRSNRRLLHITGIVELGLPDSTLIAGTLRAARQHGIAHEVMDAAAVTRRFPGLAAPDGFIGVWQGDGGFVTPEAAILAQVALARAAGAELRTGERVLAVAPRGDGVRVTTERGTLDAGRAIVAAGPWLAKLLPGLAAPLRVTREVLAWFAPSDPTIYAPERCPVFLIENQAGIFYGFPTHDRPGVKFAKHHHRDEAADPDLPARPFDAGDEATLRAALARHLPGANGALLDAKTCFYTNTPDGDFILDRLPGAPQIVVASPCSGHGFKFAPVIGGILADLATAGATPHDISRFALARFG